MNEYIIRDREAGNFIAGFATLPEAEAAHIASTYREKCWEEVFGKIVNSFWFENQLPKYKNLKITLE